MKEGTVVTVAILFDSSHDVGMALKVILYLWRKDASVWAMSGLENRFSIQSTLENITDHILPGLRQAEESGDLLGINDPAFLHKLVEKFEEAAELAGAHI